MNPLMAEEHYLFLPLKDALAPPETPGEHDYVARAWWVVSPEKGLMFHNPQNSQGRRVRQGWGAPQYNTDERVARIIWPKTYPFPTELVFMAGVWIPRTPE